MKVVIRKDYDACSSYVAEYIAKKILERKTGGKEPFVLGLPTGSTPIGVYKILVEKVKNGALSFRDVVTFNMDEYAGLSKESPQSYAYFMMNHLFNFIDIDPNNINIPDGMAKDAMAECNRYEEKIAKYEKIDLFFGGVGTDGHIAFNEPCTSFASRTHVQPLAMETIHSNSRFFNGDLEKVPKKALTIGVGTLMDSDCVLIMATGVEKAQAVQHAIEGAISHAWPITALQMHKNAILVCDEDAMSEVKLKTYKYFKEAEED